MTSKKPILSAMMAALVIGGLTCVGLEMLTRAYFHVPLFHNTDWRTSNRSDPQAGLLIYDPLLGWGLRPNFTSPLNIPGAVNTIEFGLRRTTIDSPPLHAGAILAVGDSFTAGSEVEDQESWPAYLEGLLGKRVLNAGAGGYGTDQVILNAERLLPQLKPSVLLIGILAPDDIRRVGYSSFGRPKPWLDIQNGALIHHNNPVPAPDDSNYSAGLRRLLAHSFAAHMFAQAIAKDWWLDGLSNQFRRIVNNPESVTCRMLARLKAQIDAEQMRGILVMQHGGWIYARKEPRSSDAVRVAACARKAGYEIVDEYDHMRAVAESSLDSLKTHYVMHESGTIYGHMSPVGNAAIADLIAAKLRQAPEAPPSADDDQQDAVLMTGAGVNLLDQALPSAYGLAATKLEQVGGTGAIADAPVLRLTPASNAGEHYFVTGWQDDAAGPHVLSLYLRENRESALRLQLHDDQGNAAIADIVPATGLANIMQIKDAADIGVSVSPAGGNWLRLTLYGTLAGQKGKLIVQLIKPDQTSAFPGRGEEIVFQGLMVERGQTASAYCVPGNCRK